MSTGGVGDVDGDGSTGGGGGSIGKKLTAALSFSVLGYEFLENPQGAILALVYDAVVDLLVGIAAAIGFRLGGIWDILLDAVVGGAAATIGGAAGAVGGVVEDLLERVGQLSIELAGMAGPLGFVVAPVVWVVAAVAAVYALAGLWRGYKWLRVVVA